MDESLKPKFNKTAAGAVAGTVIVVTCFGHEAKEQFLDTAHPVAVVLGTGASTSVSTVIAFNVSTTFLEQQTPERVSAERPPFNNGRAALVVRAPNRMDQDIFGTALRGC